MRLRTLPLSLAGVLMGTFLAASYTAVDWKVGLFLYLTAILLQILSNLSNELGDALHGTDNADTREGMHYSIMDGTLTIQEMRRLIRWTAVAASVSGFIMIWLAFGSLSDVRSLVFLCLGAMALWAAMHYTLGDNPYGYRGLGDVAVFVFFGLATVLGGFYLCAGRICSWSALLPASAIGFFSVGVLNVNNIRDMKSDAATRRTVAIRLGERGGRIYQIVLIALGWAAMVAYSVIRPEISWIYIAVLPLYIVHLRGVWTRSGHDLDRMLPLLVISTFILSLLAGVGFAINQ